MSIDWSSVASGAGAGAGAGAMAGGIGAIPGALIGGGSALIGGLLAGDKPEAPKWQDFTDPTMSTAVQQLMRKKLGALQANRQRTLNERNAKMQIEKMQNDPNASHLATTNIAAANAIGQNTEERNVTANIAGAETDQNAMMRAAQIQEANQKLSYDRNMFNRGNYQMDQQPSAFQSIVGSALSQGIGSLMAPKVKPIGDGSDPAQAQSQTAQPDFVPSSMQSPLPQIASPDMSGVFPMPPTNDYTLQSNPWDKPSTASASSPFSGSTGDMPPFYGGSQNKRYRGFFPDQRSPFGN